MAPLISIIIPIFNNENSISATIKSIINQTYHNFEVIFIDDGSVDNSMKILKKYIKRNKNIHSYKQFGFGAVSAEKFALTKAKGKYVLFFESGKIMSENMLEYLSKLIEKYKTEMITFDYFSIPEYTMYWPNHITRSSPEEKISIISNTHYLKRLYSSIPHSFESCIILWNKLINRKWLLSTSYMSSPHQLNISYSILQNTCKILKSTQFLVCEVLYDEHFIQNCFNYTTLDKIDFLEKLLIQYKRNNNTQATINTAIRLLDLLYKTRKQLHFYSLQLYDKSELREMVNKKFNSVYKFLITKFPDKEYRYSKINKDYRAQIKFEKFRERYFYLYDEYIED